jgi:two-component system, response regulator YesN
MYKVIIIDDEAIVRMGIRTLINWKEEGFEICEEGRDGRDGLQKIFEYQPELVLIDIKMPGLGGIEVIKEAIEQGFTGKFIILTGHSEFEYAKSAITLGVKAYLLKPIDENELMKYIKNIYTELKVSENLLSYHKINEEKARKELLRQLLLNYETEGKLDEKIALYKLDFVKEVLCVAIIQDSAYHEEGTDNQFNEKIDELLAGNMFNTEKVMMEEHVALISHGIGCEKWTEILNKGNERVKRIFGSNLFIAVGHNVTKWYDLCYSYEFARYLAEKSFLFSKQLLLSIDTIHEQLGTGEKVSIEYLDMLIDVGDVDSIQKSVYQYKSFCMEHLVSEVEIKLQVLYYLLQHKNNYIKKYGIDQYNCADVERMIQQVNYTKELDELLDLYNRILCQLSQQIGYNDVDNIVKKVIYFMENNYSHDLKLEKIAKLFNYNSAYLGQLFIKVKGDNFTNTLDMIRITNAKRLLAESDMKVYQISDAVGYKNIDLFYKKFKKQVGVTPKDYLKSIQK